MPDLPSPPLEGQVGGGILLGLAVVCNVLYKSEGEHLAMKSVKGEPRSRKGEYFEQVFTPLFTIQ